MTSRPVEERRARLALAIAMALAAVLLLWETRDNTFFNDEVSLFQSLGGGLDADVLLQPRNGHLQAVSTLLYEAVFGLFGPEYLVLRLVAVAGLLALSALVFAYVGRRVGATLALAPAIVILFLGAAWESLLWPISIATFGFALAAGIGALLCLERGRRGGDAAACALLVLAVASHSIGLPFLVGAAILVLLRPDRPVAGSSRRADRRRRRWRSLWVVAVPLVLYAAWWLWALKFDQDSALSAVNAWLAPAYVADALAAVLAAVTGLSAPLGGEGLNPAVEVELGWGRPLALVAIAALVWRLARPPVADAPAANAAAGPGGRLSTPPALWATLAVLLVYWGLAALSLGPDRSPSESRYILPGAILVFLVASNALAGVRIPRPATIAVFCVAAIAVATGIRQLHDGELYLRDYALRAQATLAGIERARGTVPYGYEPRADPELSGIVPPKLPLIAGPYLEATDRFGSFAFTESELEASEQPLQDAATQVYGRALAVP